MISTGNPAANPAVARDVTRGELQPGHGGQRRGNQAALQRDRREAIGLSRYRLHRRGGPVGGHLQQLDVVIGKPAGREGADMHHADHPAARHHRHSHHGLDALGPQDRVQHGRVIDVVHDHRLVLGGDPPGEPLAHRDAHALVAAHKRTRTGDGQLLLVIPGSGVLRIFAITGLDQVIPHVATLEEALAQPPDPPDALI
jgi:hypothetical protein